VTWQNILKLGELEWLLDHQFQHRVIFSAAGYVSMVIDAACAMAKVVEPNVENPVRLVELTDLLFHRAITFVDDFSAGVEMVLFLEVLH
jgi:hypothetical protein